MGLVGKNRSKVRQHDPWSESTGLYNRKKSEIEDLFREVDSEMKLQHLRDLKRKENGSHKDKIRALLNYTRAKAVYDTVRWVAVERGARHPLSSTFVNQSAPNNGQ